MAILKGIVPKYLAAYSALKIVIALKNFNGKTALDSFYSVFIIILGLTRILGLKYIHSEIWLRLTIISILVEPFLIYFNNHLSIVIKTILEIFLSIFSLLCVVFFHPYYRIKEKKKI